MERDQGQAGVADAIGSRACAAGPAAPAATDGLPLGLAEQRALLDNELIGIAKVRDQRIVWHNAAMGRIFGHAAGGLLGQPVRLLCPDAPTFARLQQVTAGAHQAGERYRMQLRMVRKDGKGIWIDLSGVPLSPQDPESMWMLADITPMRQSIEKAEHLAFHDALTGLPNRLLLSDRLTQALAAARRQGELVAVCYIDLDGFKAINDEFGHTAGDWLLKEVARRLQRAVRRNDTVCRLGGDEFVLVMTQVEHKARVQVFLQRLVALLATPIAIDARHQVKVSATIGAAICPDDGDLPDILIGNADWAMDQGKKMGRNQVCMYGSTRAGKLQPYEGLRA